MRRAFRNTRASPTKSQRICEACKGLQVGDFPRVARSCSLLRTGTLSRNPSGPGASSTCFVSKRLRSKSGVAAFTAGKVRVARIYARCGIAAHLNLFLSIKRSDYIIHPTIPSVNSKRAIKKSSFIIHIWHRPFLLINKRAREEGDLKLRAAR